MDKTLISFTDERAAIISSGNVNHERLYSAYIKHCKDKNQNPVSENDFFWTGQRIIVGLRDWLFGLYKF